jgi:hypothetical protein
MGGTVVHRIFIGQNTKVSVFFAIFGIIGTIIMVVGIFRFVGDVSLRRNAVQTTGTITHFEVRGSGKNRTGTAFVTFTVGDEQYKGKFSYWHTGMRVNQPVDIYYDPTNPHRFRGGSIYIALLLPFGGLIFFLAGFIPLYILRKRASWLNQ